MEIIPGVGLPVARLGQTRRQIEDRVGVATALDAATVQWQEHSPPFGVCFDGRGRAALVEVYLHDRVVPPTTVRGVQLIGRPVDHVVADLAAAGLQGHQSECVVEFAEGFMLWSLLEVTTCDIWREPGTGQDPFVVEGVAVTGPGPRNEGPTTTCNRGTFPRPHTGRIVRTWANVPTGPRWS